MTSVCGICPIGLGATEGERRISEGEWVKNEGGDEERKESK